MKFRLGSALALAFAVSGFGTRADAATISFDLENQASTSLLGFEAGGLTSLTLTSPSLSMTLTRPGSSFDIAEVAGSGVPASFGARSLSPFASPLSNTPFLANFSSAVTGFSFSFGDFAGALTSDVDTASIVAYSGLNGTGTLLGSVSSFYGDSAFPTFNTFGITGAGIRSVVFIGGSSEAANSVFYDNFVVTTADTAAVPEPSSIALVSIAGLALVAGRKVVRKKVAAL